MCSKAQVYRPGPSDAQETRLELIGQLEAAEEIDESNARNPRISMVRKEDFYEQADKAERAIRELMYGYEVLQSELAGALAIPAKRLSAKAKGDLIRQLQDSIAINERREQNRLNDYVSEANIDTARYMARRPWRLR